MIRHRSTTAALAVLATAALCGGPRAQRAAAFNPLDPVCKAGGLVSGIAGKACGAVAHPGRILGAGKKLLTGHPLGAIKSALGDVPPHTTAALGLAAIVASVVGGAKFALRATSKVLAETTSPQLRTTWFSSTYWRMAGFAALLTLPFLFAAAIQALLRSDLALLARSALGYLPLAMLAVGIAAPLTMLLLAASDELSALVSSAAANASGRFLDRASGFVGLLTVSSGSPFLAFLVGLFTVAGALFLWVELLLREAAVYVIVLMLPLAFAALVWPARRGWALRAVELLLALILSKFAIVAVLSLGGAAMAGGVAHASITGALAGLVLVVMAAFAPWALLRLIPLAELASAAVGSLRLETRSATNAAQRTDAQAHAAADWTAERTAQMRREAEDEPAAEAPIELPEAPAQTEERPQHADAAADAVSRPPERAPGLGPMFQRPNWTWQPLVLGLDEEGELPPLHWQGAEEAVPAVPGREEETP